MKIFISSVQKEFATERKALADYLSGDPLLRRFFETFLFERDVPASDRPPDSVYLEEVRNCDLYPTKYIERMGTGTRDMIKKCIAAGLPEPEFSLTDSFVTTIRKTEAAKKPQVTPQPESRLESPLAAKVVLAIRQEPLGKASIAPFLGHKTVSGELHKQIKRLVNSGIIEPTIPEKPTSRLQKYRLTESQAPENHLCPECGYQYQPGLSGDLTAGCPKCLASFLDDEDATDPDAGDGGEILKVGDHLDGMEIPRNPRKKSSRRKPESPGCSWTRIFPTK